MKLNFDLEDASQVAIGAFALAVPISFSEEAREMMEDRDMSVAKAMIAAGIEAVGNVAHDIDWEDDELDASDAQPSYTLH